MSFSSQPHGQQEYQATGGQPPIYSEPSQDQTAYITYHRNPPPQRTDTYYQQQTGITLPQDTGTTVGATGHPQSPIASLSKPISDPEPTRTEATFKVPVSNMEYGTVYTQQQQPIHDPQGSYYVQNGQQIAVVSSAPSPSQQKQLLQPPMPTATSSTNSHSGPAYITPVPDVVDSRASMVYKPVVHTADDFHYGMCGFWGDFFKCNRTKINICCCGFWCPCVLYSRIHHRLRSEHPARIEEEEFSCCNGQCWAFACLSFTGMGALPFAMLQRDEIRHKYKLNGSCWGDFCRNYCCMPCSLCQAEKEVIFREKQLEQLVQANRYEKTPGMSMSYVPQEKH